MDTDSIPAAASRPRGRGLRSAVQYAMIAAIVIVLAVWMLSAVGRVRDAAARMTNSCHLKCLGLAMHTYADFDKDGRFPGANAPAEEPQGGGKKYPVSWRVLILPYIEQDELFKLYRFDEPWDGPNNIRLLDRMPKTFRHPKADSADVPAGHTHYRVFVSRVDAKPSGLFADGLPGPKLKETPDGTSNTILIVEAADAVPWTMPEVLLYDRNQPLPKLGGLFEGQFQAALADGSIHVFRSDIAEDKLRAWITGDGGEPVERE